MADRDFAADRFQFHHQCLAVTRHPDRVPSDHDDRCQQDTRVEYLLADAADRRGNGAGKRGDQKSAGHPGAHSKADPASSGGNTARCGIDDADNQRRLQYFPQDEHSDTEHAGYLFSRA